MRRTCRRRVSGGRLPRALDEFAIIERYFARQSVQRRDVVLGIGDDAALVKSAPGVHLAVTTDVLVGGVHFPAPTAPYAIGYKALAVNLSDLAAMGAEPAWATLMLTVPTAEEDWLQGFCDGFFCIAREHGVQLIGGDMARGPLSVGVQLIGTVPEGQALVRAGAKPQDDIYVSGTVGDAALGLMAGSGDLQLSSDEARGVIHRLEFPTPRVALGVALRGIATAAIDVSDGLAADLGHIATASAVAASVDLAALPLSTVARRCRHEVGWDAYVAFGDDYELCFSAPPARRDAVTDAAHRAGTPITRIGTIQSGAGVEFHERGSPYRLVHRGHDHFAPRGQR